MLALNDLLIWTAENSWRMEKVATFYYFKNICKKGSVGVYRVIVGNCVPNFNDTVQRVAKIACS